MNKELKDIRDYLQKEHELKYIDEFTKINAYRNGYREGVKDALEHADVEITKRDIRIAELENDYDDAVAKLIELNDANEYLENKVQELTKQLANMIDYTE